MAFDTTSTVYVTCEAITGFVTVVGNTVVFVAIVKTRQLHTVTNVFIGNLAVADILVGLFVAPLAALSFIGLPKDVFGCIFINSAILIFTNVSILMLLGVAVERFIAIRLPFAYDRILTIRRALLINVLIWFLGFLLGLMPMYGWNIAPDRIEYCSFLVVVSLEYMIYFQFFGLVVLPVLAMLVIYLYIFSVIRKHIQRNDTLQNMFRGDRRSRSKWNKEVRAAKFFALLIFLFAVCWMPINILNSISFFCKTCSYPPQVLLAAIVMSHANSSINPILYAASNSRIQSSIKSLLGFKQGSEDSSADVPSGKMASMAARLGQPSFNKNNDISTIAGNKLDNTLNHMGTLTCQSSPPNGIPCSPCSDGFPELRQLSPKLLHSIEDSENGSEADIQFPNGSVVNHAHDMNGLPSPDHQVPSNRLDVNKSSPKHIGEYTSNNVHKNNTSHEHTTPMPPVSPKKFLGHINFAFADDAANNDDIPASSSSSLQRKYETFNSVHNDDSETAIHDASERRNNEKDDCRAEKDRATGAARVRGNKAAKVFVSVTRSPEIFAEVQDAIDEETVGAKPSHSAITNRNAGLFPMEDEPVDCQEFNKITFVTSETGVVGSGGVDDGGKEKEDAQTKVTHSYFRSPNKKSGSSNVTDVEINAADIFACAESCQTKL